MKQVKVKAKGVDIKEKSSPGASNIAALFALGLVKPALGFRGCVSTIRQISSEIESFWLLGKCGGGHGRVGGAVGVNGRRNSHHDEKRGSTSSNAMS